MPSDILVSAVYLCDRQYERGQVLRFSLNDLRWPASLLVLLAFLPTGLVTGAVQEVPSRTPEPKISSSLRVEDVKFTSNETEIAGTLVLPRASAARRRFPAVILISGSNQVKDEKFGIARAPKAAFAELTNELAQKGIAVLRYDNRCTGKSGCKPEVTLQDHNEDAQAAIRMLAKRTEVDPARIVLIGHDEGGIFASHAAAPPTRDPVKAMGLVTIAMPGRIYSKTLRLQEQRRLIAEGKSESQVADYMAQFDQLVSAIVSGSSSDISKLDLDKRDPMLATIAGNVHYFFNMFLTDPLQVMRAVHVPVLIIHGGKDAFIDPKEAVFLNEIQKGQYNADLTMKILPEMDHWMRIADKNSELAIDDPARPLDPAFISTLTDWLTKRFSPQAGSR